MSFSELDLTDGPLLIGMSYEKGTDPLRRASLSALSQWL